MELIFSNVSVIADRLLMIDSSEDGIRDGLLKSINSSTMSLTISSLLSLLRLLLFTKLAYKIDINNMFRQVRSAA